MVSILYIEAIIRILLFNKLVLTRSRHPATKLTQLVLHSFTSFFFITLKQLWLTRSHIYDMIMYLSFHQRLSVFVTNIIIISFKTNCILFLPPPCSLWFLTSTRLRYQMRQLQLTIVEPRRNMKTVMCSGPGQCYFPMTTSRRWCTR